MSFLDEYDALDDSGKAALTGKWLAVKPLELFAELRQRRPILSTPLFGVIVTKRRDVLEVLSQSRDFSVRLYAPRMERITGSFILGMDNTPLYQQEVSVLRLAIKRDDLPRIKELVAQHADGIIAEAVAVNRLDVVNGLARLVPARLIADYFGVPAPDEQTMFRWTRTIFQDIFLNLRDDPQITEAALRSAAEMREYVDALIVSRQAEVRSGAKPLDDVLGRLLQMQCNPSSYLDNLSIRRNLIGLIAGAIDTTSKAIAHLIDQLLRRPDKLRESQDAAMADDDALLSRYLYEALRFNPQNTILLRYCEAPYILAKGTERAVQIEAGQRVFAATSSAMYDSDEVNAPDEFRVDRPAYHYIHFGHGLHTCFGEYINQVQVMEVSKRLLKQPGLRRVSGEEGELNYSGPFPKSMFVEFA
jgi:cytochrome P450